jgi:hypothetical protein
MIDVGYFTGFVQPVYKLAVTPAAALGSAEGDFADTSS